MDILDRISDSIKRHKAIVGGGLAAAVIGGISYAIYNSQRRSSYLSASALGKRGTELENYLGIQQDEGDARKTNYLSSGETFHKVIQRIFEKTEGATYEVKAVDDSLGVKGYIDLLLPDNIPVEIKTISSKGLSQLEGPLESHQSQLNFYLHARKAKYGYVLYLDGEDISNTKVFQVGYSPGRLLSDVSNARQYITQNSGKVSKNNFDWLKTHIQDNSGFYPGIRHSDGGPSSWDSINQNSEFPGGRLNSVVQASRYNIVKSKNYTIPTLGLTIRKSETAIGHRSRSKGAKSIRPTVLYNGSRRYR